MSVQPLLAQLRQEAAAEASRRLEVAQQRAAQILAEGADDDARDLERSLAEHERLLRQVLDRQRDDVMRQCHLQALEARRRLVTRVLTSGEGRVEALVRHPCFGEALRALMRRTLEYLPASEQRVRGHPAVVQLLRQDVGVPPGLRLEEDRAVGFGFVTESADGKVRVDATFGPMLQRARAVLAMRIVAARNRQGATP